MFSKNFSLNKYSEFLYTGAGSKETQLMKSFDSRPFKVKNAVLEFLCPLCGVERGISVHYKLTKANYIQISILSVVAGLALYPVIDWAVVLLPPTFGVSFEFVRRSIFRKEVPCPHCGFDAVWYKKDVPKARELVHQFWSSENAPSTRLDNENSDT